MLNFEVKLNFKLRYILLPNEKYLYEAHFFFWNLQINFSVSLKKVLETVEAEKEQLEERTQQKSTNLNNVRPQLQTILQVANGVRNKLGLGGVVGVIGEAVSYLTGPLGESENPF